jgi:hypothetical protein
MTRPTTRLFKQAGFTLLGSIVALALIGGFTLVFANLLRLQLQTEQWIHETRVLEEDHLLVATAVQSGKAFTAAGPTSLARFPDRLLWEPEFHAVPGGLLGRTTARLTVDESKVTFASGLLPSENGAIPIDPPEAYPIIEPNPPRILVVIRAGSDVLVSDWISDRREGALPHSLQVEAGTAISIELHTRNLTSGANIQWLAGGGPLRHPVHPPWFIDWTWSQFIGDAQADVRTAILLAGTHTFQAVAEGPGTAAGALVASPLFQVQVLPAVRLTASVHAPTGSASVNSFGSGARALVVTEGTPLQFVLEGHGLTNGADVYWWLGGGTLINHGWFTRTTWTTILNHAQAWSFAPEYLPVGHHAFRAYGDWTVHPTASGSWWAPLAMECVAVTDELWIIVEDGAPPPSAPPPDPNPGSGLNWYPILGFSGAGMVNGPVTRDWNLHRHENPMTVSVRPNTTFEVTVRVGGSGTGNATGLATAASPFVHRTFTFAGEQVVTPMQRGSFDGGEAFAFSINGREIGVILRVEVNPDFNHLITEALINQSTLLPDSGLNSGSSTIFNPTLASHRSWLHQVYLTAVDQMATELESSTYPDKPAGHAALQSLRDWIQNAPIASLMGASPQYLPNQTLWRLNGPSLDLHLRGGVASAVVDGTPPYTPAGITLLLFLTDS